MTNATQQARLRSSCTYSVWLPICVVFARLAIGCAFLLASGAKLLDFPDVHNYAQGTRQLILFGHLILMLVELFVGSWMVIGIAAARGARTANWMLIAFACYNVYSIANGEHVCNCFGRRTDISPMLALVIDLTLISLIMFLRLDVRSSATTAVGNRSVIESRLIWLVFSFLLLVLPLKFIQNLYSSTIESSTRPITFRLDDQISTKSEFALIPFMDDGSMFRDGEWIVLVYRRGCDACQLEKSQILDYARNLPNRVRVGLVEVPVIGLQKTASRSEQDGVVVSTLRSDVVWKGDTPLVFTLADGRVHEVARTLSALRLTHSVLHTPLCP
jgi:hypothetical protein